MEKKYFEKLYEKEQEEIFNMINNLANFKGMGVESGLEEVKEGENEFEISDDYYSVLNTFNSVQKKVKPFHKSEILKLDKTDELINAITHDFIEIEPNFSLLEGYYADGTSVSASICPIISIKLGNELYHNGYKDLYNEEYILDAVLDETYKYISFEINSPYAYDSEKINREKIFKQLCSNGGNLNDFLNNVEQLEPEEKSKTR